MPHRIVLEKVYLVFCILCKEAKAAQAGEQALTTALARAMLARAKALVSVMWYNLLTGQYRDRALRLAARLLRV